MSEAILPTGARNEQRHPSLPWTTAVKAQSSCQATRRVLQSRSRPSLGSSTSLVIAFDADAPLSPSLHEKSGPAGWQQGSGRGRPRPCCSVAGDGRTRTSNRHRCSQGQCARSFRTFFTSAAAVVALHCPYCCNESRSLTSPRAAQQALP